MDPLAWGAIGAKTAGSLWGNKPVSTETNTQGEIRKPVSQPLLSKMAPYGGGGGGSSSFPILPLAIGGLALFLVLKD